MKKIDINNIPDDYALFECNNGKIYAAPKKSCYFCKHVEIIYDSGGPYMLHCNIKRVNKVIGCNKFEDYDGSKNI